MSTCGRMQKIYRSRRLCPKSAGQRKATEKRAKSAGEHQAEIMRSPEDTLAAKDWQRSATKRDPSATETAELSARRICS